MDIVSKLPLPYFQLSGELSILLLDSDEVAFQLLLGRVYLMQPARNLLSPPSVDHERQTEDHTLSQD